MCRRLWAITWMQISNGENCDERCAISNVCEHVEECLLHYLMVFVECNLFIHTLLEYSCCLTVFTFDLVWRAYSIWGVHWRIRSISYSDKMIQFGKKHKNGCGNTIKLSVHTSETLERYSFVSLNLVSVLSCHNTGTLQRCYFARVLQFHCSARNTRHSHTLHMTWNMAMMNITSTFHLVAQFRLSRLSVWRRMGVRKRLKIAKLDNESFGFTTLDTPAILADMSNKLIWKLSHWRHLAACFSISQDSLRSNFYRSLRFSRSPIPYAISSSLIYIAHMTV